MCYKPVIYLLDYTLLQTSYLSLPLCRVLQPVISLSLSHYAGCYNLFSLSLSLSLSHIMMGVTTCFLSLTHYAGCYNTLPLSLPHIMQGVTTCSLSLSHIMQGVTTCSLSLSLSHTHYAGCYKPVHSLSHYSNKRKRTCTLKEKVRANLESALLK